jgi:hypothetical protein
LSGKSPKTAKIEKKLLEHIQHGKTTDAKELLQDFKEIYHEFK